MDIWLFWKTPNDGLMDDGLMDGVSLLLTEKLSVYFNWTHSFLPTNSGSTMAPRIQSRSAVLRRA